MSLLFAFVCSLAFGAWSPTLTVSSSPYIVEANEATGPRLFIYRRATYNAKTFRLLSDDERSTCCGGYTASAYVNGDGTYDVQYNNGFGTQAIHISKYAAPNGPLIVGGTDLIPWIVHVTHATTLTRLTFSPFEADTISIEPGVEGRMHIAITPPGGKPQHEMLDYNPCTLVVSEVEYEYDVNKGTP
jgi:hypothetical protein